jgi:hypothetical protein
MDIPQNNGIFKTLPHDEYRPEIIASPDLPRKFSCQLPNIYQQINMLLHTARVTHFPGHQNRYNKFFDCHLRQMWLI